MGANQIISSPVAGPIHSDGGAIIVTGAGSIAGGPDGVDAISSSITQLVNNGAIDGAAGATSASGGLGVSNFQTIATLINNGLIDGGAGGAGSCQRRPGRRGGVERGRRDDQIADQPGDRDDHGRRRRKRRLRFGRRPGRRGRRRRVECGDDRHTDQQRHDQRRKRRLRAARAAQAARESRIPATITTLTNKRGD